MRVVCSLSYSFVIDMIVCSRDTKLLTLHGAYFHMVHFAHAILIFFSYSPVFPSCLASIDFVDSVPQSNGSISIG